MVDDAVETTIENRGFKAGKGIRRPQIERVGVYVVEVVELRAMRVTADALLGLDAAPGIDVEVDALLDARVRGFPYPLVFGTTNPGAEIARIKARPLRPGVVNPLGCLLYTSPSPRDS